VYVDPYHQRLVAGTTATLSWQQIDGTGDPADPGTVTVGITRADGTELVAAGAATGGATTAARTYALTAAQTATIDRLYVTWTASGVALAVTEVDVVAAPWWSNAEIRTAESSLNDEAKYTVAKLAAARLQVEAFIERCCNRRFTPGYTLETRPGTYRQDIVLRHPDIRTIRSVAFFGDLGTTASTTFSSTDIDDIPPARHGVLTRDAGWPARWVQIGYEHGLTVPPPDLKRQAMRLCRELLVNETKGQIPDNATNFQQSGEFGWSAVLVTPGVRGAHTRLPSVNEAIDAWTFHELSIG
jgi:hypothetical protein